MLENSIKYDFSFIYNNNYISLIGTKTHLPNFSGNQIQSESIW
jgi:hypothetical protein